MEYRDELGRGRRSGFGGCVRAIICFGIIQQHGDGLDVVPAVVGREEFFDAVPLPRRDEPIERSSTGRVVGVEVLLFDVFFRRLTPRLPATLFVCLPGLLGGAVGRSEAAERSEAGQQPSAGGGSSETGIAAEMSARELPTEPLQHGHDAAGVGVVQVLCMFDSIQDVLQI